MIYKTGPTSQVSLHSCLRHFHYASFFILPRGWRILKMTTYEIKVEVCMCVLHKTDTQTYTEQRQPITDKFNVICGCGGAVCEAWRGRFRAFSLWLQPDEHKKCAHVITECVCGFLFVSLGVLDLAIMTKIRDSFLAIWGCLAAWRKVLSLEKIFRNKRIAYLILVTKVYVRLGWRHRCWLDR